MDQPVILCGLGRVGSRVLEYLRAAGVTVVVIDTHASPSDPRLQGVRLVQGDCRQREVLEQAELSQTGGVLILTSDDLVNISTTLMVRHLNPQVRVVVRVFNQNLIPRLGKAGHNAFALSVSAVPAPLLALTALGGDALGAFALEDGRRQIAEVAISENSPLLGRTVEEAAVHQQVLVLAHFPASGADRFLND